MPRQGPLSKILGPAIGLVQESIAGHKNSKQTSTNSRTDNNQSNPSDNSLQAPPRYDSRSRTPSPNADSKDYSSSGSEEDDETEWFLDEAQQELAMSSPENAAMERDGRDVQAIVDDFVAKHPPPPYTETQQLRTTGGPLPMPVILPQQRPTSRTRGFVRAYAPALGECGIDQATFLDFLDGMQKAIKLSPAFHAVNAAVLGAAITMDAVAGPSLIAHTIAKTVHVTVEGSRRQYNKYKTNEYLTAMNNTLFKPHGLYALILTYKPTSQDSTPVISLSSSLFPSSSSPSTSQPSSSADRLTAAIASRDSGKTGKFHGASGKTHEFEIPEAAPLVFPTIAALPDEEKQGFWKKQGLITRDYFDRREQAKFSAANPDSRLSATTAPTFASRYADPNHAANNGGLFSLLSGGAIPSRRERPRLVDAIRGGEPRTRAVGRVAERREVVGERRQRKKGNRGMKRFLKEDVVYLMVVNMPSEGEMREAMAAVGGK